MAEGEKERGREGERERKRERERQRERKGVGATSSDAVALHGQDFSVTIIKGKPLPALLVHSACVRPSGALAGKCDLRANTEQKLPAPLV